MGHLSDIDQTLETLFLPFLSESFVSFFTCLSILPTEFIVNNPLLLFLSFFKLPLLVDHLPLNLNVLQLLHPIDFLKLFSQM